MTAAEKRLMRAMARALRKREATARSNSKIFPHARVDYDAQALALDWAASDLERIVVNAYYSEYERHQAFLKWLGDAEKEPA